MTTTTQQHCPAATEKETQTELSLRSMREILQDEDKFNLMIQSLYSSIPFQCGLGKRNLMIMISDSIDVGNAIDIEEAEVEEFVDCYIK